MVSHRFSSSAGNSSRTLVEMLGSRVALQSQTVAYAFGVDAVEQQLTYGELHRRAVSIAVALQDAGAHGEQVLLLYPPGLDFVVGLFGCIYAGAIAVPAYAPRSKRLQSRLQAIAQDSGARFALTTALMAGKVTIQFDALRVLATDTLPDAAESEWIRPKLEPSSIALLQYTSGSTGTPKGVILTHENLLANAEEQALVVQEFPTDRIVTWTPMFHDMGFMVGVVQPCRGIPMFGMPPSSFVQRPYRWLKAISDFRGTVSGGPNFAYELCIESVTEEEKRELDLSSWRVAFNGAEPIRADTVERFCNAFARCGFRPEAMLPCYGLAEATLMVSVKQPQPSPTAKRVSGVVAPLERKVVSCGSPLPSLDVVIADPATSVRCDEGAVGEIWVRGASVSVGYWDRAEENRRTFNAKLDGTGEGGFLRTGDLGFLKDGELFVAGRLKDLIIIRGVNHYPQDIEWAVGQCHPALTPETGAAFSVQGDAEERLVIVQEAGRKTSEAEWDAAIDAIRRTVSEQFELQPTAIVLIAPGTVARTSSGKIQRHACKQQFLNNELRVVKTSSASAQAASQRAVPDPVARTRVEIERWLSRRLTGLLGVAESLVDPQRPFAEYGLDSKDALRISGELEQFLGCSQPADLLYSHPTVAALSEFLAPKSDSRIALTPVANPQQREPIAIVGMGARFPGAKDLPAFWNLLRHGIDAIGEVPLDRWPVESFYDADAAQPGKANTRWGGFLSMIDRFDAAFFGISRREAEFMDPQQRILMEVAWQAIEDAGMTRAAVTGANAGTFIGVSTNEYGRLIAADPKAIGPYLATGNSSSIAANRLAYTFDWRGPSLAIDTACSSSLVAVDLACRTLWERRCEFALAGGVNLILSPALAINFSKAGLTSPEGRCKSFDAGANGFVRSEGAGIVVLKRLSDAVQSGDRIYGTIRASAVNQDGRSNGLMAPRRESQAALLKEAYEVAGVDPAAVTLVEAHGSGTVLGDSMELSALAEVLGGSHRGERWLGSVKSNIGHTEAAAGVAGLVKAALALHHGQIPPSLHFERGNPHTPPAQFGFEVPTALRAWPQEQAKIAGVSSFGFGGTNVHVVVEGDLSRPEESSSQSGPFLLPLSGHSPEALQRQAAAYASFLRAAGGPSLADICYSASVRRTHHGRRAAFAGFTKEEIGLQCQGFLQREVKATAGSRKRAFVFAGHGSQHLSMGCGLFASNAVFRKVIEEFSRVIELYRPWSLVQLLAGEPVADRNDIETIQPALLAIECGLAAVWRSWGVEPHAVCGVSLGEIIAAHVAGMLSVDDAVRMTCMRSTLLKGLQDRGGMLMTGLAAAEAEALVGDFPRVSVGICSSPHSTVLSGDTASLARIQAVLDQRAVFARMVDIPYASHSPAVDRIRRKFFENFTGIASGVCDIAIYSTVTGKRASDVHWDVEHWWGNLRAPVLFAQVIEQMLDDGFDTFVEISPHPVHTSSILQTIKHFGKDATTVASLRRGQDDSLSLLTGAGKLYEAGDTLAWSNLSKGGRVVSLPPYSFDSERFWLSSPEVPVEKPLPAPEAVPHDKRTDKAALLVRLRVLLGSLLGVSADRVDTDSPLLEMGADSIILLSAVDSLQQEFGVKLSIRQFFEQYTTLSALADHILEVRGTIAEPETERRAVAPDAAAELQTERHVVAPDPSATSPLPVSGVEQVLREQLQLVSQTVNAQLQLLAQLRSGPPVEVPPVNAKPAAPPQQPSRFIPHTPIQPGATSGMTGQQQVHVQELAGRYTAKTARSKQRTQEFRGVLADNRASAGFRYSVKEMLYPIQAERSSGSRIWDIDGNEYIDLTMGFGVNLFGHGASFINEALQAQVVKGLQLGPQSADAGEVASLIAEFTGFDRVTFCNSGSEAVMMAIRLARTATSRNTIALFAGSYHGTYDGVIAQNDLSRRDGAIPFAPGILPGAIEDVLVLEYGDPASLEAIQRHGDTLAAVLVEPVQSRRPDLQPRSFLQELREITRTKGIALIFDEVITGFRLAPGGAQEWFGVRADLATYGKVVGGGMPIGVVAGASRYMDGIDGGTWNYGDLSYPSAKTTFFAGTFCKHPLAMAASKAVLQELRRRGSGLQSSLNDATARLVDRLNRFLEEAAPQIRVVHCGSLFRFVFSGNLDLLFYHLLDQGVYIWEGRNCFLSTAHTQGDIDELVERVKASVWRLQESQILPSRVPRTSVSLDDAQRQIWLASSMDAEASIAYHVPAGLELHGHVSLPDLQHAVEMVVDRHLILRSRVDEAGEHLIFDAPPVAFRELACLEEDLDRTLQSTVREPFDLATGPLLRAAVVRLSAERHILLVVGHHLAVDGASMILLLEEIGQGYSSLVRREPVNFKSARQFSERLIAQQNRTQDAMDESERFWMDRLGPHPAVTDLPADFTRPNLKTYGVQVARAQVSSEALAVLKEVARRNACSLFMSLFAIFTAYLHRLTGQESLIAGIPAADRSGPDEQRIIGNCTNILPVQVEVRSDEAFTGLLSRVKQSLLDVFDHIHYPFSRLIRRFDAIREVSRTPLVDAMFNLDRATSLGEWQGLRAELFQVSSGAYPFDLHLNIIETRASLKLELQVNRDLFTEQSAVGLLENFCTLLQSVAAAPECSVGEFNMLKTAEPDSVSSEWNQTQREYPQDRWIHEVFADQARRTPESAAVRFNGDTLSYRELDAYSKQLARFLRLQGAGPEIRVGVCLKRSFDLVVALLAILKAGAAYVPFDPDYPPGRLNSMVEDAQTALLITTSDQALFSSAKPVLIDLLQEEIRACVGPDAPVELSGANAAYVIFTSGSTGRPKGAVNTHAGILNRLWWMQEQFALSPSDRVLQKTPFSFDVSVWEFFWPLMVGATLILAKPGGQQDPDYLADLIAREEVTTIHFVPSMLSAFLQFPVIERCSCLKWVLCSGEALSPATAATCLQLLPAELHNLYGPTEAAVDVTHFACHTAGETVPIGRPIANIQIHILDRQLYPVPIGSVGEIFIGGIGLGRGYLGRADATAARFIPDSFSNRPGARLYRTGDLARWNRGGNIEYLGRTDDQVKVRGFRVGLGEIESTILAQPGVAAAAVTTFGGEEHRSLAAYVLPKRDNPATEDEIRQHLLERLPRYMVPDVCVFVEEMPLTPSGKLDRKALPTPIARREHTASPPSSPEEAKLAEIWTGVLRLDRIGTRDNFFQSGGDSISALGIVARARQEGIALQIEDLFRYQTIAELASHIAGRTSGLALRHRGGEGRAPLTPIQEWFFARQFPHPEHWNQSVLVSVPERVTPQTMESALRLLVSHHDALRLQFHRDERGEWYQEYAALPQECFERKDLSQLDDARRQVAFEEVCRRLQSSAALDRGPLFRAAWFDLGQGKRNLLLIAHHLIIDGVSWRIVFDDLAALTANRPLGPSGPAFGTWADELRRYAVSAQALHELPYWMRLTSAVSHPLKRDHASGNNTVEYAATTTAELNPAQTRDLRLAVSQTFATELQDVLLTAVGRAIAKEMGASSVLLDLEGHGRESARIGLHGDEADLSRTVGWFTTIYPVVLQVAGLDAGTDLDRIKHMLRAVPGRGISYGVLRYLNREGGKALGGVPEPEIVFNFLGQIDDAKDGWSIQSLSSSFERNGAQLRPHLIEIDASIRSGCLQFTWTYSSAIHEEETIRRLADQCMQEINALAAHCRIVGRQPFPSDFPLVELGRTRLDALTEGRDVEEILPATSTQQGMLFHSLWGATQDAYVNQLCLELNGELREKSLRRACESIVDRYAVLRSFFTWGEADVPIQVLERRATLEWQFHDWSALPGDQRRTRSSSYLAEDRARGIDLGKAPLIRMSLLRLADDCYQLIWTHHHAILDGWSVAVLWEEISRSYAALIEGKKPSLAPPLSPAVFARWLKERESSDDRNFFSALLKGYEQPLQLGIEMPQAASARHAIERTTRRIGQELKRALDVFARSQKVTLNTVVQLSWAVLLARYSGRRDLVFGVTSSGRPAALADSDRMVGLFINTLPVRVQFQPGSTIPDLLVALQEQLAEMSSHQHCSLPEIHQASDVPGEEALFNHILVFENYPIAQAGQEGMPFQVSGTTSFESTNYALTAVATPGEDLVLDLLYDPQIFTCDTVERLAAHWVAIFEQVVNTQGDISNIQLLTSAECDAMYAQCAPVREHRKLQGTIGDLFEQRVAERPSATAVVYSKGELSYDELNQRANQIANLLRELGVEQGARVGICAEPGVAMMSALLGTVKMGAVYVPIPPSYPPDQISYMLCDSNARVVLVESAYEHRASGSGARLVAMDEAFEFLRDCISDPPPVSISPADPLYAIYTSGSTGRPKCAAVTQAGFLNLLEWFTVDELALTEKDRVLIISSFGFDLTQKCLFGPLLTGGTVVLAESHYDSDRIRRQIEAHHITVLNCTPTAFYPLVEGDLFAPENAHPTLRSVVLGGEPISSSRLRDWFTAHLGRAKLVNSYGPTECTDVCVATSFLEADLAARTWTMIGSPLPECEAFILDAELAPVPVGVPGELYIGGIGVGFGYLNKADLTAEKFLPHPLSKKPGERLYRTGDVGRRREDGRIDYLGRTDHQVKVRGFRIEFGEIESVLREYHGVQEAVVIAQNDILVSYIVVNDSFDEEQLQRLRAYAASRLPPQMVPTAILRLEKLPLSPNGKLNRAALPVFHPERTERPYQPAATADEEVLLGIWKAVLGVERMGVEDNFFELGGHSLLATQVVSQARRAFQVDIPISSVFDVPSVRGLAKVIREQADSAVPLTVAPIQVVAEPDEAAMLAELEHTPEAELDALIASLSESDMDGSGQLNWVGQDRNGGTY